MFWHVGHRATGAPKKSFREFRSRLPFFGHSLSKRLIRPFSKGFIVIGKSVFSMASSFILSPFY